MHCGGRDQCEPSPEMSDFLMWLLANSDGHPWSYVDRWRWYWRRALMRRSSPKFHRRWCHAASTVARTACAAAGGFGFRVTATADAQGFEPTILKQHGTTDTWKQPHASAKGRVQGTLVAGGQQLMGASWMLQAQMVPLLHWRAGAGPEHHAMMSSAGLRVCATG